MSDTLSIETATIQLKNLETKLDGFNEGVENYLFDKISDRKFSDIIESNPELAVRLQQLADDEATLRAKLEHFKILLQDIRDLENDIKALADDEKIVQRKKARAERDSTLESILNLK